MKKWSDIQINSVIYSINDIGELFDNLTLINIINENYGAMHHEYTIELKNTSTNVVYKVSLNDNEYSSCIPLYKILYNREEHLNGNSSYYLIYFDKNILVDNYINTTEQLIKEQEEVIANGIKGIERMKQRVEHIKQYKQ